MNHHASDKLAGLLYGSFIADALALGAHWIYDQEETAGRLPNQFELQQLRSLSGSQEQVQLGRRDSFAFGFRRVKGMCSRRFAKAGVDFSRPRLP
jgi:hypothetical protein